MFRFRLAPEDPEGCCVLLDEPVLFLTTTTYDRANYHRGCATCFNACTDNLNGQSYNHLSGAGLELGRNNDFSRPTFHAFAGVVLILHLCHLYYARSICFSNVSLLCSSSLETCHFLTYYLLSHRSLPTRACDSSDFCSVCR